MKRKGFTLVELLVVIAIIALLISILAPSLNAAKNLARQVICNTNLKALGTAVVLYAEANKGNMMPGYWMDRSGNGTPSNPDGLCLAFGNSAPADDGYLSVRHTLGSAYVMEIWKPESLLYCPSLAASGTIDWGDAKKYPQPWGTKAPTGLGTALIRVTYMYSPHITGAIPKWLYSLQLANMPSNLPTLTDMFCRQSHWGHTMSGVQWFMVYPDTHVGFKTNQTVVNLIKVEGLDPFNGPAWPDYTKVYDELF
jgi:prepilin-type N-terminal cleavage/methylation domain-containing protein